jgi:mono/diheme cytochrome c family protein
MKKTVLPGLIVFLSALAGIPLHAVADEVHHPDSAPWAAPAKEAARKNPVPADTDSIARGGAIYNTHCALCHGEKGKGDGVAGGTLNPRPADLTKRADHLSDGDLAWKIAHGRGVMPGFKNVLAEEQIWDVVNFIRKGM